LFVVVRKRHENFRGWFWSRRCGRLDRLAQWNCANWSLLLKPPQLLGVRDRKDRQRKDRHRRGEASHWLEVMRAKGDCATRPRDFICPYERRFNCKIQGGATTRLEIFRTARRIDHAGGGAIGKVRECSR